MTSKQGKTLTDYVTQQVEATVEKQKSSLATKDDIAGLKIDIVKLESKISEAKTDTIKWVFTFFVTMALMIVGLYLRK